MGNIYDIRAIALLCLLCVCGTVVSVSGESGMAVATPYSSWRSSVMGDADSPGGGPVLESAVQSVITVCPYGCDYDSIQTAINASASHDTILVSGGTYPESLTLDKPLSIRGVNGTVLIGSSNQDYGVKTSSDNVTLENLSFTPAAQSVIWIGGNFTTLKGLNMTGQIPESPLSPVIFGTDINAVLVSDCQITTTGSTGISFANTTMLYIYNNSIELGSDTGTIGSGIDIVHGALQFPGTYIFVDRNRVKNGEIYVGTNNKRGDSVVYPGMDVVYIGNNIVSGSNFWGINAGGFEDTNGYHLFNFTIRDNIIEGSRSPYSNLKVSGISHGQVINNTVRDLAVEGDGMHFSNLDQFLIQDNSVTDGTVLWWAGFSGFYVEQVINSIIRNNTVTNILPFGYDYAPGTNMEPNLTFDATNTADGKPVVYRERLRDQVINSPLNVAMVVLMSCNNSMVRNVSVTNSGLGIGVYNSENILVSGNQITDSNTGMMLIQTSRSEVIGNTFNGSWMGLGIGDNDQAEISGNTFSKFSDTGIVIHTGGSNRVNITQNTFTGDLSGREQAIAMSEANGSSILVTKNTISHASRGMLLAQSTSFSVKDNLIQDCGIGINLLGAQENEFTGNRILNTDEYSEGMYVISSQSLGGGISANNRFINNYIQSARPVNVSTIGNPSIHAVNISPAQWGPAFAGPVLDNFAGVTFPNVWNITKTPGVNIVHGQYLGGNCYVTPDGTGWSQTHPDRGDGFVSDPYVFDDKNTDFLPLHTTVSPTPTPTPTPTPVYVSANFTADPVSGTPPLSVQFTDTSGGQPTSWNWTFGDGTVSHEQNPIHVYHGIGRYTVTLKAGNKSGQSVMRKPAFITPNAGRVTGPNGMIWITSSPSGAQVSVDHVYIGETPLQSPGIPAGIHQVRVTLDGYRGWIGYVQVSQGSFSYIPRVILRRL